MSALVELTQFGARTNSRVVADAFEKEHKDVLRAIDGILEKKPELIGRNFTPDAISVTTGFGSGRQVRAFQMDRDGFTLVAMGFTGDKALDFKLAFINAFNQMEAVLKGAAGGAAWSVSALMDLGPALALVREARQVFGRDAARRIWPKLGLPDVRGETSDLVMTRSGELKDVPEVFQSWFDDRVVVLDSATAMTMQLYDDFLRWCRTNSVASVSVSKFGTLLGQLGFTRVKNNKGCMVRQGLMLND